MIHGLLVAIDDKLVIHPLNELAHVRPSGIYVPDPAIQKTDQGIVVSVGEKVKQDIKVGDHVVFSAHAGDKVSTENGEKFIIHESNIVAKIVRGEDIKLWDSRTVEKQIELAKTFVTPNCVDSFIERLLTNLHALPFSEGFEF